MPQTPPNAALQVSPNAAAPITPSTGAPATAAGSPQPPTDYLTNPAWSGNPPNSGPPKAQIEDAYGPTAVLASAGARASDIARAQIPAGLQTTVAAITQAGQLRNDAINALTMNSSVPGRLKMVQERVEELVPKPGEFTHGPAEAATKWKTLKNWVDTEYAQKLKILDPSNIGYDRKAKEQAAQEALSLRNVSEKIDKFVGGTVAGTGGLSIGDTKTINGITIKRVK
jgi:hypothetical protein